MHIEIGTIADVLYIDSQIPEFDDRTTKEKVASRLADKNHLILIARIDGELAGYKMGYALSDTTFYSWLGGVIPTYRKKGLATHMRLRQEQWAQESGYETIEVKSMNCYPAMLQLLISSGYQIIGYEEGKSKGSGKILFSKSLS